MDVDDNDDVADHRVVPQIILGVLDTNQGMGRRRRRRSTRMDDTIIPGKGDTLTLPTTVSTYATRLSSATVVCC